MRRRNVFSSRRIGALGWILILLGAALAVTCAYTAIDDGRIVIKTQSVLVAGLPESLEGFTILHISDLNAKRFGQSQKRIYDMLSKRKYNAVCLTGDMVGESGDMYPFHELLSALDTTKPVFFIAGDSDPSATTVSRSSGNTALAEWITGAQVRRATYLDAPAAIHRGDVSIWFSDASQLSLDLDIAEAAYASSGRLGTDYYADIITRTKAARQEMRENDIHIVLSHNPVKRENMAVLQSIGDSQKGQFVRTVDLILSGGAVGGQWRLPLLGPVWADGFFPRSEDVLGYHYTGSTLQYISGGLSTSGIAPLPAFRLFNTPEITLITLTSVMDEGVLPGM